MTALTRSPRLGAELCESLRWSAVMAEVRDMLPGIARNSVQQREHPPPVGNDERIFVAEHLK